LVDECLPELNKESFQSLEELESAVQALLKVLKDRNEHARYEDTISVVRGRLNAAKVRELSVETSVK